MLKMYKPLIDKLKCDGPQEHSFQKNCSTLLKIRPAGEMKMGKLNRAENRTQSKILFGKLD
jgi:hypothetical protein